MTKTLQLAKPFNPAKLDAGVFVSQKLDGVPVRFDVTFGAGVVTVSPGISRQGKEVPSVEFIRKDLQRAMERLIKKPEPGTTFIFVGEVTHDTYTDFKDVSGVVRTQGPMAGLIYNAFDFYDSRSDVGFAARLFAMQLVLGSATEFRSNKLRVIPQNGVYKQELQAYLGDLEFIYPNAEGFIIRNEHEKWQPGKRTWGYQKYVVDPTIDLRLHSFEEAVDQFGNPKGMIGRMNFYYEGRVIGVGPGKMPHDERYGLWQMEEGVYAEGKGPMACIKYKRDDSYDDLRQPTFQYWRDDKDEADA